MPRAPPIPDTAISPPSDPPSTLAPAPATPVDEEPDNTLADGMESQEFDRVQWAKCQARAERYEEEVQLTVEEMGRTLLYFEWKRDWWLAFVSGGYNASDASGGTSGEPNAPSKPNASLPIDIQDGLDAYARRQSQVYDDLIASFVGHWRKYLLAHSLGTTWLDDYPPLAVLTPVRPSRGHSRSGYGRSQIAKASVKPTTSGPPTSQDSNTDIPLGDGSDNDGNDNDDTSGETDAEADAEEMFAEEMFAED